MFGLEFGIEQQPGHADHAIHRRANFVTHVGEKFALGARGRFRRFFRPNDFGFGPLALDRERDLIRHSGEKSQVALAVNAFLFIMLHRQDADGARRSPQRHAQPRRSVRSTFYDFTSFEHLQHYIVRQQQRLSGSQDIAAQALADRTWIRNGINFIDPEFKMDQAGGRIVKSDETIFRVKKFTDRTPGKIEKLIEIIRRNNALNYFGDDLALRFRPLLLGYVFDRADMTGDGAIIANCSRFGSHPTHISARRLKTKLRIEFACVLSRLLPFRDNNGRVGRMDRARPTVAEALLQGQPSDRMPTGIRVKKIAGSVGLKDADRRGAAQSAKALFTGAELSSAAVHSRLEHFIRLFQFCPMKCNAAHLPPTLEDRHDQENILEYDPGGMFHPAPRAHGQHAEN